MSGRQYLAASHSWMLSVRDRAVHSQLIRELLIFYSILAKPVFFCEIFLGHKIEKDCLRGLPNPAWLRGFPEELIRKETEFCSFRIPPRCILNSCWWPFLRFSPLIPPLRRWNRKAWKNLLNSLFKNFPILFFSIRGGSYQIGRGLALREQSRGKCGARRYFLQKQNYFLFTTVNVNCHINVRVETRN